MSELSGELTELVDGLLQSEYIKFDGPFTLKEGQESVFYVNLRETISDPDTFAAIAHALGNTAFYNFFEPIAAPQPAVDRYLMGIPEAMSEYAGAIGYHFGLPLLKRRVQQKSYGEPRSIEGRYINGDEVVLLDDVISSSQSKLAEVSLMKSQGLKTYGVAVLVDRQQGGRTALEAHGIPFAATLTASAIAKYALQRKRISQAIYDTLLSELDQTEYLQSLT